MSDNVTYRLRMEWKYPDGCDTNRTFNQVFVSLEGVAKFYDQWSTDLMNLLEIKDAKFAFVKTEKKENLVTISYVEQKEVVDVLNKIRNQT